MVVWADDLKAVCDGMESGRFKAAGSPLADTLVDYAGKGTACGLAVPHSTEHRRRTCLRGGTGRCSLGRGDDGSVHLVAKCGEEYCTASNSTLNSLLVWKTAQPCAAKRRLPPSRPPSEEQASSTARQPDDEQIMRACQAYRAALAVRLRR